MIQTLAHLRSLEGGQRFLQLLDSSTKMRYMGKYFDQMLTESDLESDGPDVDAASFDTMVIWTRRTLGYAANSLQYAHLIYSQSTAPRSYVDLSMEAIHSRKYLGTKELTIYDYESIHFSPYQ